MNNKIYLKEFKEKWLTQIKKIQNDISKANLPLDSSLE